MRTWLPGLALALAACGFHPSGERPGDGDASVDGGIDDAAEGDAGDSDAGDAAMPDAGADAGDAATPDAATDDAATDAATADAATDAATDAEVDAGPIVMRTLVDDSTADFGAGPPALVDGRIDAPGVFAPRAYYVGGLCTGGSNSRLFDDGTTATWAAIPAAIKVGLARATQLAVASGGLPTGVGITDAADWTYWFEGEVYLTAGGHAIGLSADDHGFIEMAPPGSTVFTKVVGVNAADGLQSAAYNAVNNGWHGIRYAVAQRTGAASIALEIDAARVPRRLTRCRVDGRPGLTMIAFDEAELLDVAGATLDGTTQVVNMDWASNRPTDLGLTGNDTYAVRWSGQLRIDVAGAFTFRLDTDDGQRLWIDGVKVLDAFDDSPHVLTTGSITLTAGWHDVVVEHSENIGDAHATLRVQSGPELTGAAIPPARLRPSEARRDRFESSTSAPSSPTPIDGSVVFNVNVPAGATVTGVDVGYRISHPSLASVSTSLVHAGITSNLRGAGSFSTLDRFHPAAFDGALVSGAWTLNFSSFSPQAGQVLEAWLTVHYADLTGSGPIAPTARLESSVRDLLAPTGGNGAVVSIDQLRLAARDVTGDVVSVWLRTCDAPGVCAGEPWAGPYASGASPGVVPRRYVQYAIDLSSDTDHEPALDRLELDYQTQ